MSKSLGQLSGRYGLDYSPSNVTSGSNFTIEQLKDLGISYIRLQWVDLINHVRCRVIPISYFVKLLASARPGISIAKAALGIAFLTLSPGFSPSGEYLYVPDLSSFRICAYAPGHATVMGWFQEKHPIDSPIGPTLDVEICPRSTLRRVVE